jgi:hypothetical protein
VQPAQIPGFLGQTMRMNVFLFNDHSTPSTWYRCNDYCESYRGHMLCIDDADKQLFIETGMSGTAVWISYNDLNGDGDWTWTGKCKDPGYTDWGYGNVGPAGYCGYLWASSWWSRVCGQSYGIVCACQGRKSEGLLSSPVSTSDNDDNHNSFASLPIYFYFPIVVGGLITLCIVPRFVCPRNNSGI